MQHVPRTVLDAQTQREIIAILSTGGDRRIAARYVGCRVDTIRRAGRDDPAFAEQLRQAEARAEILHVRAVGAAAAEVKNWRAAAWLLERLNPDRFGRRKPHVVTAQQVSQTLTEFAEILFEEVPPGPIRRRVLGRLTRLVKSLRRAAASKNRSHHARRPER